MINKIIHFADIHFRTYQRHTEFRSICEYLIDKLIYHKPNRVVITGDIVHSRNQLTPELVNEVTWFLNECSNNSDKLIIIPGNHDIVEQNKERLDALTPIINAMNKDNILYFKESDLYVDDNVVWTVFSIYNNNAAPQKLYLKPHKDKIYVGLYHGVIAGAVNSNGFKFAHGSETSKFDECDLTLCGDIHKRQVFFNKNNKPIIMVGSLIQQNYGESISEHGYCVLTLNEKNDGYNYMFEDIENPIKYLTFKVTDIEDIENDEEVLING
jgi:DNA repair exonuclease SbcCD nuclease subunit